MKKIALLFLLCGCGITNNIVEQVSVPSYPEYLKTADAFVYLDERTHRSELKAFMGIDPYVTEWCAAFVNSVLRVNSIPGSESVSENPLLARGFLDWGVGVDEPKLGDIVVFARGNQGWQGHVAIYIRTDIIDGKAQHLVLGGNQDDRVSYEYYSASTVLGYRRWID